MPTPAEKFAQSLDLLHRLQEDGRVALHTSDIPRAHRERLLKNGFLKEVMKGWYVPTRPDEAPGETTAWYASFWSFCAGYLTTRFGKDWSLTPDQSIALHAGNRTVPQQLIVRSPKAKRNITPLLHGTSLLDIVGALPNPAVEIEHMRVFSIPAALVGCSPAYFTQNPTDTRAVLATVRNASEILPILLDGGHTVIAGRLAGAFRNISRDKIADDILGAMRAAGYEPRESDPFESLAPFAFAVREPSPYASRIRLMWQKMRAPVIDSFPAPPGRPKNIEAYLTRVQEAYVTDAYHSLSIEGYRVTPELIERVRSGAWNPDSDKADRDRRNALAARGYWQAFQVVRASVSKILAGENPGAVADDDHATWFRELFAPGVAAQIITRADLAGYRDSQVYIRRSRHVPPSPDAVRDSMPVFFELLREETEAAVRVVLGHFALVYIHPYMDGNGRMGRFMMNAMLTAGGYPWTVTPVSERNDYLSALEQASVDQDILPFARFLGDLVSRTQAGRPLAAIPAESK